MPPRVKHREPFAERLVQIRKANGLSQYDLARMSGISNRMIAYYETRVKNPSSAIVMRLAKALKVNIPELMGQKPLNIKEEVSRKTIKKAKMLEELPPEAQKSVMKMIDTLHTATRKT